MDRLRGLINRLNPQKDCDLVDRITCYYTCVLLSVFSFIIFGWSLFGTPIQCWFPAQYRGWWAQYALDYCYVQNTYFVKFHDGHPTNHWELNNQRVEIPTNDEDKKSLTIGYYQWVPFVLALMAIAFYVPVAFWRSMYEHSGISVRTIMQEAGNPGNADSKNRANNSKRIARYLDQTKKVCERFRNTFLAGRYVTILYLGTKLMCAGMAIGQFFLLEHFLGVKNGFWGVAVLNDIRNGREWTETGNFPRVTLCDYKVRELGNIHQHTAQCVLIINMLNEKIFVFLWFWFAFVVILSVLSFLFWTFYAMYPNAERQFILGYLLHIDPKLVKHKQKDKLVADFVGSVLKQDGIFLLRLIVHNSGDLVCAELVEAIWFEYKRRNKIIDDEHFDGNGSVPPLPNVRLAVDVEGGVLGGPPPEQPPAGYPTLPNYDDAQLLKHRPAPPPPPPRRPPPR